MYKELTKYYEERIFGCTRCTQRIINPYLHTNPKHDAPDRPELPYNRRKFQEDYIASKKDIRLVIVGEAPGLDGCGYGGIAFTGEHNAICDLGLPNYHNNQDGYQKEQSANLIYGALRTFCAGSGADFTKIVSRMYLTNAIMCVPLGKNGKSITAPTAGTKKQCRDSLIGQLEIIKPKAVVTLGANALGAVADAYELKIEGNLTALVRKCRNGEVIPTPVFTLIPEIHPSPRNRVLGELYDSLPKRLTEIFASYLV